MGRPTDYTDEIGEKICQLIAEGNSLVDICAKEDMPSRSAVLRWVLRAETNDDFKDFATSYARAMEIRTEVLMDETIPIADNATDDVELIQTKSGSREVINNSAIARARLQIETRMKMAAFMKPKKYGNKTSLDHDGSITIKILTGLGDANE